MHISFIPMLLSRQTLNLSMLKPSDQIPRGSMIIQSEGRWSRPSGRITLGDCSMSSLVNHGRHCDCEMLCLTLALLIIHAHFRSGEFIPATAVLEPQHLFFWNWCMFESILIHHITLVYPVEFSRIFPSVYSAFSATVAAPFSLENRTKQSIGLMRLNGFMSLTGAE